MPTLNVILNGARGGQGTSTVASVLALYAAGHSTAQLVAIDASATAAVLGIADPGDDEISVTDRLTLANAPSGEPDVRIIDAGTTTTTTTTATTTGDVDMRLVVLRGPCYIALRTLVRDHGHRPDGIVLLSEPGRSLTARDVHDVTGVPVVATVPFTAGVAGTIDAGLLIARLHRLSDFAALRHYIADLVDRHVLYGAYSATQTVAPTDVRDLNAMPFESASRIGTDLPVPLSGTGRDSPRRRVRRSQRAFPPRTEVASGRSCVEHRQAQQRCCGVLHRRGRVGRRGLLHRSW